MERGTFVAGSAALSIAPALIRGTWTAVLVRAGRLAPSALPVTHVTAHRPQPLTAGHAARDRIGHMSETTSPEPSGRFLPSELHRPRVPAKVSADGLESTWGGG